MAADDDDMRRVAVVAYHERPLTQPLALERGEEGWPGSRTCAVLQKG